MINKRTHIKREKEKEKSKYVVDDKTILVFLPLPISFTIPHPPPYHPFNPLFTKRRVRFLAPLKVRNEFGSEFAKPCAVAIRVSEGWRKEKKNREREREGWGEEWDYVSALCYWRCCCCCCRCCCRCVSLSHRLTGTQQLETNSFTFSKRFV